jgi:FtsZ-binding cell division protein ZapB
VRTSVLGGTEKMKDKKTMIIVIAAIMAAVATALFLVVEVTTLFVTAYIFALIGIALLCFGNLYLLSSGKSYPWFASFPLTIWRYLISQITVSAIFIIVENLFDRSIPLGWFVLIHIILLAFFSIMLILQKGGKDIIERIDEKIQAKYIDLRMVQLDVESVKERVPMQEKEIQAVVDALRYSMPMSHDSIAPYEEKIKDSVFMLEQAADQNDTAKISELCVTLLRQIKDRNSRATMIK